MISVDPSERPTFDSLLHMSRGNVFPESFYSFLYNYVSSLNELSAETVATNSSQANTPIQPSVSTLSSTPTVRTTHSSGTTTIGNVGNDLKNESLPSDSDHRLERIWLDYESIEPYITPEQPSTPNVDVKIEFTPNVHASKPVQVFPIRRALHLHL